MARGTTLTISERYAVRAMLEDRMSVNKIAETLGRSNNVVKKYIDKELKNVAEFIDSEQELMPEEVAEAAIKQLVEAGYSEFDATACISRIKKRITKTVSMGDLDAIVRWADTHKSPKESFVTKTDKGRKGFAIMTEASSEVLDGLKAKRAQRHVADHIFKQEDAKKQR
jgi:predicted transcriptional regulator